LSLLSLVGGRSIMTVPQVLVGLLVTAVILFWVWSLCRIASIADKRAGYDEEQQEG